MTDKLTESAPPTIWLQVDTDGDADDRSEPLSDWSDTTWCSESIGGQEVEYTRSDIAAAEIARLTAENVELRTLNKVLEMYYFDARTDLIAARAKLKEHVHD